MILFHVIPPSRALDLAPSRVAWDAQVGEAYLWRCGSKGAVAAAWRVRVAVPRGLGAECVLAARAGATEGGLLLLRGELSRPTFAEVAPPQPGSSLTELEGAAATASSSASSSAHHHHHAAANASVLGPEAAAASLRPSVGGRKRAAVDASATDAAGEGEVVGMVFDDALDAPAEVREREAPQHPTCSHARTSRRHNTASLYSLRCVGLRRLGSPRLQGSRHGDCVPRCVLTELEDPGSQGDTELTIGERLAALGLEGAAAADKELVQNKRFDGDSVPKADSLGVLLAQAVRAYHASPNPNGVRPCVFKNTRRLLGVPGVGFNYLGPSLGRLRGSEARLGAAKALPWFVTRGVHLHDSGSEIAT